MNDLEKMEKEIQLKKLEATIMGYKLNQAKKKQEIERLDGEIEICEDTMFKVQQELKEG